MPSSLPPELERLIFEMAILQDTDHDSEVQILLVAKRVYEWIRPILYRVAIVTLAPDGTIVIRNRRSAQLSDVAPFIRHLLVAPVSSTTSTRLPQVLKLLSTFRNVEILAIWITDASLISQLFKAINGLPLRMLSVGPADIALDEAIKDCPTLRNVTHLEIFSPNDVMVLREFPNLTHLCFHSGVEDEALLGLLRHCPSLRAMVWNGLWFGESITDDVRFLLLVCKDYIFVGLKDFVGQWEARTAVDGGRGRVGAGIWELADVIIEARKGRLFKDDSSFIFFRETWMDHLNEDGMRWYLERGYG